MTDAAPARPCRAGPPLAFRTARPLHFGDCDPSGIAFFPAYTRMLVEVMEDFFAAIGAPLPLLLREQRIGVPTVRLDLTFARPGFHGDRLDFSLRVVGIGRSSLDLDHDVTVGGFAVWCARQRVVATSLRDHKACAWPAPIRAALGDYLEMSDAHHPAA